MPDAATNTLMTKMLAMAEKIAREPNAANRLAMLQGMREGFASPDNGAPKDWQPSDGKAQFTHAPRTQANAYARSPEARFLARAFPGSHREPGFDNRGVQPLTNGGVKLSHDAVPRR